MFASGSVGEESIVGVLDTGADETILPGWALARIGHAGSKGQTGSLRSVSGQFLEVTYGVVRFRYVAGLDYAFHWTATVAFAAELREAIFGHAGFLEHFVARFDGYNSEFTLTPRPRDHKN